MKKITLFLILLSMTLTACTSSETIPNSKGVYLLLDTSGTYTKELRKAQQIIGYLLGTLKSFLNLFSEDAFFKSTWVAASTRTSTRIGSLEPIR